MAYVNNAVDISEDYIQQLDADLLLILLRDHSSKYYAEQRLGAEAKVNPDDYRIIWATDDYAYLGDDYKFNKPITPELITGSHARVIMPRVVKSRQMQSARVRAMAEVFTPSWVCNVQNNLIDAAWFGGESPFNTENPDHSWTAKTAPIIFPENKTWRNYVRDRRLEITCGEAPYLCSRYDTTNGSIISLAQRIGLLDRKLRVVSENTETSGDWLEWADIALQNTYGYEWQGDNLLLARENMLFTFLDYYVEKFGKMPQMKSVEYAAYIISWNLWQMDGLKNVSPLNSVSDEILEKYEKEQKKIDAPNPQLSLFEPLTNSYEVQIPFCVIKNWKSNKIEKFIESLKTK